MDITNERAHRQYPNVQVTGKLDIFLHTVTHYTGNRASRYMQIHRPSQTSPPPTPPHTHTHTHTHTRTHAHTQTRAHTHTHTRTHPHTPAHTPTHTHTHAQTHTHTHTHTHTQNKHKKALNCKRRNLKFNLALRCQLPLSCPASKTRQELEPPPPEALIGL